MFLSLTPYLEFFATDNSNLLRNLIPISVTSFVIWGNVYLSKDLKIHYFPFRFVFVVLSVALAGEIGSPKSALLFIIAIL